MKKRFFFAIAFLCFVADTTAQTPNFTEDIAPIIWQNCTYCHRDGGIAHTTLITYNQVVSNANDIRMRINTTDIMYEMPPWCPDPNYRHYIGERILTDVEKNLITTWIDNGTPAGDTTLLPAPPTYPQGSIIGTPDMVLRIPNYTSHASAAQDDYICFVMQPGIVNTKMIRAIEIIPGNYDMVHHVSVYKNTNGFQTDTSTHTCMGNGQYLSGYVPGIRPVVYPSGNDIKIGMPLHPNEDVIIEIHYSAGSNGMMDSTRVNLFFYDDTTTNIRAVKFFTPLSDNSFCISNNTVDSVALVNPVLFSDATIDISLLSIAGHCHWLGKEFLIYLEDSLGNTIPLLSIPQWSFLWQGFYSFEYLQRFPPGYRIYGRAIYDNTTNNAFNPNMPPQTVCVGQNSTDEMFSVFGHYIDYEPGDENINIAALMDTLTNIPILQTEKKDKFLAYPNPFGDFIKIEYELEQATEVKMQIYNLQGQLIKTLVDSNQTKGLHLLSWDGLGEAGTATNGLYLVYLNLGGKVLTKKIILVK